MSDLDPEFLREFLLESRDHVDRMEAELVVLERDPQAGAAVDELFRALHTIKGAAGFLELAALERLTHTGESLLARLRDRELVFTPALAALLLRLVDAVRATLAHLEAHQAEGDDDHRALEAALARAAEGAPAPAPSPAIAAPPSARAADPTIRVDVGVLDELVNLAGELILARNRLSQLAATWTEPAHLASWQRLDLVASRLQEQVMKTRMQPIGTGWARLPRTVRDLAAACGKQVRIELEGEDTELDRTLIEAMRDPLVHVLRNAIDHGIETPAEREAAGKEAEGVIRLRAHHDSGQVHVEISDDGGGIRAPRIRAKAIQRGLIDAEQAARMSDDEVIKLVFLPGFSTAEAVTSVSGRGVGMDVVRANIEQLGGQVELTSVAGLGTTLRITIPLTLAILPALIVECRGVRYAIPQAMLRELVKVDAAHPIERIHDAPLLRLRGRLLPLIDLSAAVGGAPVGAPRLVLVIATDGVELGLVIERYHDVEEIVVKPLGRHLRHLGQYSGATILGDGRVVLIIDARALARAAGLVHHAHRPLPARGETAPPPARAGEGGLLLVRQGPRARFAVPLDVVLRLADVEPSRLERTGDDELLQLDGDLVPILRLGPSLGADSDEAGELVSLIVCRAAARRVAIPVDQVLDIVDERPDVRTSSRRAGVSGTTIIDGHVVELLDLPGLIAAHHPHLAAGSR